MSRNKMKQSDLKSTFHGYLLELYNQETVDIFVIEIMTFIK